MARLKAPYEKPGDIDAPIRRWNGKVQLQPQSQYGPAMQALTPRWRRFVYCYLANGGRNATKAYMEAGFGGDSKSAQGHASKLLHDSRIQAALREETKLRMVGHAPLAVAVLQEVMDSSLNAKDRMTAARAILDRTGFMASIEHKVTHEHTLNNEQALAQAKAMAAFMGIPEQQLLGYLAAEEPIELIAAPEGLEDIW